MRLDSGAADAATVYSVLVDFLSTECCLYDKNQFHTFLNCEPVVCRSCFRLLKKHSDMRVELQTAKNSISRAFLAAHVSNMYLDFTITNNILDYAILYVCI